MEAIEVEGITKGFYRNRKLGMGVKELALRFINEMWGCRWGGGGGGLWKS